MALTWEFKGYVFKNQHLCPTFLQENAVNLLEDTADFVSSQLNSGTTDPGVLQDVGASLLHGISNVISATSSKAEKGKDDEETDEEKQPGNEEGEQQLEKEKEATKAEKEKVSIYLFEALP